MSRVIIQLLSDRITWASINRQEQVVAALVEVREAALALLAKEPKPLPKRGPSMAAWALLLAAFGWLGSVLVLVLLILRA